MKKLFFTATCLLLVSSPAFAAKQTIGAADTGAQTRTKLNANFTELYDADATKANITCFASAEAFGACFDLDWISANPSFNSVHASGGNLAAANKQVTKAWQSGLSYTAGVTSVIHGGQHYIAKTTHTAGSTSEPGVGASWETDWAVASGGGGGYTNLTSFVNQTAWRVFYSDGSGDVKELALGYDGEYLKSNGASAAPSWATPSGAAHNAITLGTDADVLLGLSTQQLTLDSQTANYVFAAPNGSAGDPTFRALVAADLPYTFDGDAIGEVIVVHDDGSGNPVLPFTIDIADLTDTDGLFTAKANTSCFASESAFNACFDLTWATGGATNLDGLSDVVISGTPTTNYVLKFNGTNWVPAADATSEGAGYVETPPTYSDATCTKGQYSFDSSYFYMCEATNQWDRFAVTWGSWSNPTPVTPTLTGRVIGTNGTTLTLTGSASLSVGSGGNGGFDVDCSTAGNGITATYASGAPGTDLVYTLGTTVNSGDTCDLDYTQPGNGIEATTGGADLASITSASITNNSTQSSITNLVLNGDFSSGTGWDLSGASIVDGVLVFSGSGYAIVYPPATWQKPEAGVTYNYSIDVSNIGSGNTVRLRSYNDVSTATRTHVSITTNGTHTGTFTGQTGDANFAIMPSTNAGVSIDNFVVWVAE
jgi:hypothetical protein